MCHLSVLSLSTTQCVFALQGEEPHTYYKRTYAYCREAARRAELTGIDRPCQNVVPDEGATGIDSGSARMKECPVCVKQTEAVTELARAQEVMKLAQEKYDRAIEDSNKVDVFLYPTRHSGDHRRRRH